MMPLGEYLDFMADDLIDGVIGARALTAAIRAALPHTVFECQMVRIVSESEHAEDHA